MSSEKPPVIPGLRSAFGSVSASLELRPRLIMQESAFVNLLRLERRRSERSGNSFVLVLLTWDGPEENPAFTTQLPGAVLKRTRETDVVGWYEQDNTLGGLLTEVGSSDESTIEAISTKMSEALRSVMNPEQCSRVRVLCQIFPEHAGKPSVDGSQSVLYPDLSTRHDSRIVGRFLKRGLDIVGSLGALALFSPLFVFIAALVKLTSKGPVLFRQQRVGQYGKKFVFLKFRSMYVENDPKVHEEYVAKLIEGRDGTRQADGSYKLLNDPRITGIGRFLRRTSLDELPQFVNVLCGHMSLVGPRPPIPYEYQRYKTWHRRRALEIKPGITGLWQVEGRSRTTFDEMVRMDLQYAKGWSLQLDLRLLLQTSLAMFSGEGAR